MLRFGFFRLSKSQVTNFKHYLETNSRIANLWVSTLCERTRTDSELAQLRRTCPSATALTPILAAIHPKAVSEAGLLHEALQEFYEDGVIIEAIDLSTQKPIPEAVIENTALDGLKSLPYVECLHYASLKEMITSGTDNRSRSIGITAPAATGKTALLQHCQTQFYDRCHLFTISTDGVARPAKGGIQWNVTDDISLTPFYRTLRKLLENGDIVLIDEAQRLSYCSWRELVSMANRSKGVLVAADTPAFNDLEPYDKIIPWMDVWTLHGLTAERGAVQQMWSPHMPADHCEYFLDLVATYDNRIHMGFFLRLAREYFLQRKQKDNCIPSPADVYHSAITSCVGSIRLGLAVELCF
eukprot:TRINITY_DN15031_c0_g1_i1.p1 TRINITY_DN15031_c0_g1~~TRINITY_DN15031_c0_g1_i1.p1  ORF type:complete len:355 (-),score=49.07 TRINITY_DN15031_c0_g1_i1:104-1168(-)